MLSRPSFSKVLSNSLVGVHVDEPVTLERVFRRNPPGRVQRQHLVQQVQGRRRHERLELFPDSTPVLLLWLEVGEAGQVDHVGPVCRTGRPAQPRYDHQLLEFLVGLKMERKDPNFKVFPNKKVDKEKCDTKKAEA